MPVSDARKNANRKWDAENMTILACKVRKTYADAVKAKAAREGTTPNAIIKAALDDFLGDDRPTTKGAKTMIDIAYFQQAVELMDDELREQIHAELAPCTDEEFLREYERRHLEKYGEEFTI